MEGVLKEVLLQELRVLADVLVFDVSNPDATKPPRRRKGGRVD